MMVALLAMVYMSVGVMFFTPPRYSCHDRRSFSSRLWVTARCAARWLPLEAVMALALVWMRIIESYDGEAALEVRVEYLEVVEQ